MHNDKGINISRCFTLLIARGATVACARQPPPAKGRRSLPAKEKGKETEAVSRCMINMNKDKQLT